MLNLLSINLYPTFDSDFIRVERVIPLSIELETGLVITVLSFTIHALLELPSVIYPSSSKSHASSQPLSAAYCLAKTGGSKFNDLMSTLSVSYTHLTLPTILRV